MSKNIDLREDARFSGVLADLESVRTNILEKGKLAPITGTTEGDVVIEFATYGEGKLAEPSILIKITSPQEFDGPESILDEFEDYVIGELEVASREWSQEVTDLLGDERPVILLFNDEEC